MHHPPLCLHPTWCLCLRRGSPGASSTTHPRAQRPSVTGVSARGRGAQRGGPDQPHRGPGAAGPALAGCGGLPPAGARPMPNPKKPLTSVTRAPTSSPTAAAEAPRPAQPARADAPACARRWRRGRAARTRPRWRPWTSCSSPSSGARPNCARPAQRPARAPAARAVPRGAAPRTPAAPPGPRPPAAGGRGAWRAGGAGRGGAGPLSKPGAP